MITEKKKKKKKKMLPFALRRGSRWQVMSSWGMQLLSLLGDGCHNVNGRLHGVFPRQWPVMR